MSEQASRRAVNESYHPHGFESSASLKRARRPYQARNFITGSVILAFIVGVYAYSISAVKQDDFSDVVDLLPPEAERAKIRSIEDEARDKALGLDSNLTALAATTLDAPTVPASIASQSSSSVLSLLKPRRLSELDWIKKRGWVEEGKGNVLVWGAPDVDKVGRLQDSRISKGARLV